MFNQASFSCADQRWHRGHVNLQIIYLSGPWLIDLQVVIFRGNLYNIPVLQIVSKNYLKNNNMSKHLILI